jgi:hypothetical protein
MPIDRNHPSQIQNRYKSNLATQPRRRDATSTAIKPGAKPMENKKNIEILDQLHAKALDTIRAMLPILAAERGVTVGDVQVRVTAAWDYDVLTLFDNSRADAGLPYCNGTSYSWDCKPSRTAHAIEELSEHINEGGHEA